MCYRCCAVRCSVFDVRRSVFVLGMKYLLRILGVAIGGIFVYAGAVKALDPVQFGLDIDNFKILPWFISVRLAFFLPWLEILCGLAVVFRVLYRGGLSVLTLAVLVFIAATVAAKIRGLDITCGCFGHASQHWSFAEHMAIDLAIFVALAALLWIEPIRTVHDDQKN
jgi:putative oxidoreductase